MIKSRKTLLESIAGTIADYRKGEINRINSDHVERWIEQFPQDTQIPMLKELDHVLKNTYFGRDVFDSFLRQLAKNTEFTGNSPADFWRQAHLLDIQKGGRSQREMLELFRAIINDEYGAAGDGEGPFVYIDDAIFSGTRVLTDVKDWLQNQAPDKAEVRIVASAIHEGGQWYANAQLEKAIKESGKDIELQWWCCVRPENRLSYRHESDVFWPTEIPKDPNVTQYVQYLGEEGYPPRLRVPGSVGKNKPFSSDDNRILLEQQLLIAGAHILKVAFNMPETIRPLGFTKLKTLGFGSVIVTFRNCPNTCPVAFWAGDPWYPLFPRSTNTDAFIKNMLGSINWKKNGIL